MYLPKVLLIWYIHFSYLDFHSRPLNLVILFARGNPYNTVRWLEMGYCGYNIIIRKTGDLSRPAVVTADDIFLRRCSSCHFVLHVTTVMVSEILKMDINLIKLHLHPSTRVWRFSDHVRVYICIIDGVHQTERFVQNTMQYARRWHTRVSR